MPLVFIDMAELIRSEMGYPTPTSNQLKGWAHGVIQEIQTASLVNNLPGTIVGVAPPPGGPLIAGAGTAGIISGMAGASMANYVKTYVGYPSVSNILLIYCTEIVNHIHTLGKVTFDPGLITGICTNFIIPVPPTPVGGILTVGAGLNGKIINLDGDVLAAAIHAAVGYPGSVSNLLKKFCKAVVNYTMDNAQVTYLPGSVTAICPPGGGAITAGAGVAGTIA